MGCGCGQVKEPDVYHIIAGMGGGHIGVNYGCGQGCD